MPCKNEKAKISVRDIERNAIKWVQKYTGDLLAPLEFFTGSAGYYEARGFANKAYKAGFADAMLRMGVWPIEDNNKESRGR